MLATAQSNLVHWHHRCHRTECEYDLFLLNRFSTDGALYSLLLHNQIILINLILIDRRLPVPFLQLWDSGRLDQCQHESRAKYNFHSLQPLSNPRIVPFNRPCKFAHRSSTLTTKYSLGVLFRVPFTSSRNDIGVQPAFWSVGLQGNRDQDWSESARSDSFADLFSFESTNVFILKFISRTELTTPGFHSRPDREWIGWFSSFSSPDVHLGRALASRTGRSVRSDPSGSGSLPAELREQYSAYEINACKHTYVHKDFFHSIMIFPIISGYLNEVMVDRMNHEI